MSEQCQRCENEVRWLVFAAYDAPIDKNDVHPHVARYPASQATVCDIHLPWALNDDASKPGSTEQWVVKPS